MLVSARDVRRIILEQSMRAGVGHIGSALSIADIVAVLYSDVLRIPSPGAPDRDRFVLSKGHAALAVYAALHLRGWISEQILDTYCSDGTLLGVHPERDLSGVDFSTGSLGQGISIAGGAALAARLQGSNRRIYSLISDAECNEGSVWEAAMFAAHHQLSNMIVIVDDNKQQALGYTRDVLDLSPMEDRWAAFGWDAATVDGHDAEALRGAFLKSSDSRPRVVVANTVFGRGVSFMENRIAWHYEPLSEQQFSAACRELEHA